MQMLGIFLFFLVPIIVIILAIWEMRKFNQKKFSEYKELYPDKTDQEICLLIREKYWSKEETSYCDTGW